MLPPYHPHDHRPPTHTGDAVREIVKFVTRESDKPVYRQRMSCNFGPDGRLLEYSFLRALGTYIIWVLESEKRENLNLGVAIEEGVGFIARFGSMITGGCPRPLNPHPPSLTLTL